LAKEMSLFQMVVALMLRDPGLPVKEDDFAVSLSYNLLTLPTEGGFTPDVQEEYLQVSAKSINMP